MNRSLDSLSTVKLLHTQLTTTEGRGAEFGQQKFAMAARRARRLVQHAWYRRTCKLVPWERKRLFAIAQCLSFPALLGTVQERSFPFKYLSIFGPILIKKKGIGPRAELFVS